MANLRFIIHGVKICVYFFSSSSAQELLKFYKRGFSDAFYAFPLLQQELLSGGAYALHLVEFGGDLAL